jgi:hypothetical protein
MWPKPLWAAWRAIRCTCLPGSYSLTHAQNDVPVFGKGGHGERKGLPHIPTTTGTSLRGAMAHGAMIAVAGNALVVVLRQAPLACSCMQRPLDSHSLTARRSLYDACCMLGCFCIAPAAQLVACMIGQRMIRLPALFSLYGGSLHD